VGLLRRLFGPKPLWDWVQVEPTTACNARCLYCPRTVLGDAWEDRFLPLESFRALLPALARAGHVHLQGWGEPLLHPDFTQMVRLAKATGARVGTTTNATLLTPARIAELMDAGLDVLAVSLAGLGPQNDRVRKGAPAQRVLEALAAVARAKAGRGADRPEVHLAYMLLRSGQDEIETLPQALAGLGVGQVMVSVLDFPLGPNLAGEDLAPRDQAEHDALHERLMALSRRGLDADLDIAFRLPPPAGDGPGCTENPARAAVVSAAGQASACVFANLPVSGEYPGLPAGAGPRRSRYFGDAAAEGLERLWAGAEWGAFRSAFARGAPPASCAGCRKRQ
jgi:MoaA/NifB/PqqE/SkfB family radical SAM enzyme